MSDPIRLQIPDLFVTHRVRPISADAAVDHDPSASSLASSTHEYSIPVVYSSEVPSDDVTLLPLADSELAMALGERTGASMRPSCTHLVHARPRSRHYSVYISRLVCCVSSQADRSTLARLPSQDALSLPLTTVEIVLLCDDFVLGRSIVPPHAACVRPTLMRWDPSAPLSIENSVVGEMMEGYVDALGEPIDSARFDNGIVIWSSEEVSGVEAARVAQALINTLPVLDTYSFPRIRYR
ncbi:hypothetical protein BGW80DRAFT_1460438 [Lactifluus volemus]|nr:hypothetical protein BGW80DRAFT_1460438 [Lactifluus volemus]